MAGAALATAVLTGCSVDPAGDERTPGTGQNAIETNAWETMLLGWGSGPGQVGLRKAATELPAEGPSAVAVGAAGQLLVLDRLNERVLSIAPNGQVHTAGAVPRDAEHLAAADDGAFAAWSPLRATVWLSGRDGASLGDVLVPRVLRDVQRIGLESSHRVMAITSMQETLALGSPRAPLELADTLRSRREGAAFLADGRGVAARRTEGGGGEILVYRAATNDDSKPPVSWRYSIAAPVTAVRVVGAAGSILCARIERVTQDTALFVEREALCLQADSGQVVARHQMGRPGLYAPHQDAAAGRGVLAIIRPEAGGLRIDRLPLTTTSTTTRLPAMDPGQRPASDTMQPPALAPARPPALAPAERPALAPAQPPALAPARPPALAPARGTEVAQ